jgi:hypothetical protein
MFISFGIAILCFPDIMNFFIAASSVQIVRVQYVRQSSLNRVADCTPLAALTCRAERIACKRNCGRSIHDLTRSRVTETVGIAIL